MNRKRSRESQAESLWLSGVAVLTLVFCQGCILLDSSGYAPASRRHRLASDREGRRSRARVRSVSPGSDVVGVMTGSSGDALAGDVAPELALAPRIRTSRRRSTKGQIESAGPRFGLLLLTGDAAEALRTEYEAQPVLTAWGWQLEYQYETSPGGPTGLVEFVPFVAGMEQGLALPTVNLLFGLRTATDKEFAVGPNLSPSDTVVGLTAAVGKTFRIGPMNLPVNAAIVSNASGLRYSVTFGWNIRQ